MANSGIVVVSGMARGIDAAAHRGAVHLGCTVVCVAGGVDVICLPENEALPRQEIERAAVVAEAPLGTAIQAWYFPRRNRVIAGLSLGVVVIEAALSSGSLITVRMAQDMNCDIFAMPGFPLDPRCRGSNDLIRSGAYLIETVAGVLEYPTAYPERIVIPVVAAEPAAVFDQGPDPEQVRQRIIELLGFAPTPVDDLIRRCQFSASAINAALSDLELANKVELLPGHQTCLLASADEHRGLRALRPQKGHHD